MKLKRNDIVIHFSGFGMYGRIWRRIDEKHVQVVDSGSNVLIYKNEDLRLSNDYKGYFDEKTNRLVKMTSLRNLKKLASAYNAHFGGRNLFGRKYTKEDKNKALLNRKVFVKV